MPARSSLALTLALAAAFALLPVRAAEPVATLLGQPVSSAQVAPPNRPLDTQIISALLDEYAEQNALTASEEEIGEVLEVMQLPTSPPLPEDQLLLLRDMARSMVLRWKVGKALYARYGGDVIFQQGNPLEPVGALQQFLEDKEQAGAFTIHDAQQREQFYAYFKQPRPMVIPPEKVDFSAPWWRQLRGRTPAPPGPAPRAAGS